MKSDFEQYLAEDSIQATLRRELMAYQAMALKFKSTYTGFPDTIVLWGVMDYIKPSRPVVDFVETKRPKGGKIGPLQDRWRDKLCSMGHTVERLYTRQQVKDYVAKRIADLPREMRRLRNKGVPMSLATLVTTGKECPRGFGICLNKQCAQRGCKSL